MLPSIHHAPPADIRTRNERVVVVGGSRHTLDLLRLATIRSDDVVLIALEVDVQVRRFALRFAIEIVERESSEADWRDASAILVSIGNTEAENRVVRSARRQGIPLHVADRPLLSDFALLPFLEQQPLTTLAA